MSQLNVIAAAIGLALSLSGAVPSFPGAGGWAGQTVAGGRGGKVHLVTNLNASGPGSFTAALHATGPRIIVFRVSGVIDGANTGEGGWRVTKGRSDVTVAGQTSPGGVTLVSSNSGNVMGGYQANFSNGIFRFLRFRGGTGNNDDAVGLNTCHSYIFDHCDVSGGQDECFSHTWTRNITIQWCAVTNSTPTGPGPEWGGMLVALSSDSQPMSRLTFHHNLLAHHYSRGGPVINWEYDKIVRDSGKIQYINNICYNIQIHSFKIENPSGDPLAANIIGNHFIDGPSTYTGNNGVTAMGDIYAAENKYHFKDGSVATLWEGQYVNTTWGPRMQSLVNQPWPFPPALTESADSAYESVLNKAGAWPRDSMNRRAVQEVRSRTGVVKTSPIDLIKDYAPLMTGGPEPSPDSDLDGMPDFWESAMGFNSGDAGDNNGDHDGDGYTNIEEYINDLALARLCENYYNPVYPIPSTWSDYNPSCSKSLALEAAEGGVPGRTAVVISPNPCHGGSLIIGLKGGRGRGWVHIIDIRGKSWAKFPAAASLVWPGLDRRGRRIPAGVYLVRWTEGGRLISRSRMVIAQ